ncbi:hypothetical protein ACFL7M_04195, partial [Thermodesulfobacteriota bacterium]
SVDIIKHNYFLNVRSGDFFILPRLVKRSLTGDYDGKGGTPVSLLGLSMTSCRILVNDSIVTCDFEMKRTSNNSRKPGFTRSSSTTA